MMVILDKGLYRGTGDRLYIFVHFAEFFFWCPCPPWPPRRCPRCRASTWQAPTRLAGARSPCCGCLASRRAQAAAGTWHSDAQLPGSRGRCLWLRRVALVRLPPSRRRRGRASPLSRSGHVAGAGLNWDPCSMLYVTVTCVQAELKPPQRTRYVAHAIDGLHFDGSTARGVRS